MTVRKGTAEWKAGYQVGSQRGININTIKAYLNNRLKIRRDLRKWLNPKRKTK